jgi:hypothetical protein
MPPPIGPPCWATESSRPRCFLQERQQVGALASVLDAGERHLTAGHEMLRISDPVIQRLVVPNDVCGFEGGRIPAETRQISRLSIPQAGETWTRHVLVGLQGMASHARAECALASDRVAVRKNWQCTKCER